MMNTISFSESRISYQNQSLSENQNTHYADIIFKVIYETQNNQEVRVSGGIEELGFWNPEKGLRMSTTKETYPIWCSTEVITCPVDMEIKYKYVAFNVNTKEYIWESNMPDRFLKVDSWGKLEIQEEKGNNQRKINQISKIIGNDNESNIDNIDNNDKIDCSPINNENVYYENKGEDNELELRGSIISFYTDYRQNLHDLEILNYDQVKIEAMQNNPLTIALKKQIEINPEEDKFIILSALLPFNIIKKSGKNNCLNNDIENNKDNINIKEKYSIIPKYEDELYESLFRIRSQKNYNIYWIGMLGNYENFYDEKLKSNIDNDLIEFLKNEKIYVVNPTMKDYINYWIYINHILGKIFYENKIPVDDDFFINYDKYWDSYKKINELFSSKIFYEAKSTGLIMIHDINLSLVSNYIAQKNNYAKMGFYFHSQFPSLEVLKSLPFHQELLESICLCNLICFHHIEIAMKFLGAIQRLLDLYYEVKPGGKIIINSQGRIIYIHIMQVGLDLDNINYFLKNKEFLEKRENMVKKYKIISNKDDKKDNKDEKEKYIFFSFDGLLDRNNICIKFKAFDFFYESYLKKLKNINNSGNMEIIEEKDENVNSCKSIAEVKPGIMKFNSNNSNKNKNLINNNLITYSNKVFNNNSNLNNQITKENNKDINKNKIKEQQGINKIQEINNNINTNKNNVNDINKKKIKKIIVKKKRVRKGKSKSGINLSQTNKDIQIELKTDKDIFINKEPIFIQIFKDDESKIMNLYNYADKAQKEEIDKNYKDILNLANDINKKYNKNLIIIKREPKFSLIDLYSLYSIGDCYYSLRNDYNSTLQIQSFIYICSYLEKKYDIIINENSSLSPGIKGVKKVNSIDIFQNISALEKVFSFNYINNYMNQNNIKFINNNQILNWSKIFFSKLKKICFNDKNCQKTGIGLGLGFSLMKLSRDFIHLNKKDFIRDYNDSNRNLIFIDYENIIQIFTNNNKENKEQKQNVLSQLKILSSQEKNKIYIISGCKKNNLDELFEGIKDIGLASEYGFFYKKPGENNLQNDYHQLFKMNDWSWKKGILPILKGFTDRTEGSYIIEKESMLSWVYKNCDPDFGPIQANEMISHIKGLLFQNDSIIVTDENDAVNIRPKNVNEGYFISEILKQEYKNGEFPEFILVIGDQNEDEEMFKYLNYLKNNFEIKSKFSIYSVTIGKKVSNANYYFNQSNEFFDYLENLNKNDGNSSSKYSQEISNLVEQSDEFDLNS